MAREFKPHVVKQGEHVARLALLSGSTEDEVWNHEKNAELKARRGSPEILAPGDVLYLPAGPVEGLELEKGADNAYQATVPRKPFSVKLATLAGPIADEPYEVRGLPQRPGSPPPGGRTGSGGEVELEVPVTTRELSIHLPRLVQTFTLALGAMDPLEETSGVRMRLENLGLLSGGREPEPGEVEAALVAFQSKEGLEATGRADDPTLERLKQRAGV